jgi:ribosomal protein S18 acetylase RimI-like enzyme
VPNALQTPSALDIAKEIEMSLPLTLRVCRVDYADPAHAEALVNLLDAYAKDPMGGGEALSDFAKAHLVSSLAVRPQAYSVLAFALREGESAERPAGLVNCIEGFSTFACLPLVNVHDVAVLPDYRGHGVGEKMLVLAEAIARERGACKMTLEVLQGNAGAARLYRRFGFDNYQLDPAMGQAQFMQKLLAPLESPTAN